MISIQKKKIGKKHKLFAVRRRKREREQKKLLSDYQCTRYNLIDIARPIIL